MKIRDSKKKTQLFGIYMSNKRHTTQMVFYLAQIFYEGIVRSMLDSIRGEVTILKTCMFTDTEYTLEICTAKNCADST